MTSGGPSFVGCLTVACSLTVGCGTQPAPVAHLQAAAPGEAAAAPSTTGTQPVETPAVFHTATGRLAAYEPRTRLVAVEAATGVSTYHVAADARVWVGRRRVSVSDLSRHLGAQTTVAFAEANGIRTTHTVRLAEGERAGRPR